MRRLTLLIASLVAVLLTGMTAVPASAAPAVTYSSIPAIAFDHIALRDVLNALDPDHAAPPACSAVLPFIGG